MSGGPAAAQRSPQVEAFLELVDARWSLLQTYEERLADRSPVFLSDLSEVTGEITTPLSLQHVGEQITEIAKADWVSVDGLDTVVAYLGELADLWETVFGRHRAAARVFAEAGRRPYCLYLRSFASVGTAVEGPGGRGRVMMYVNDPQLDANIAATLTASAGWLNPVCCLHTDDMGLLVRSTDAMPAFRVQTVEWQPVLRDAIASAGAIVFYLDEVGPGVAFELDRIREGGLESRTVLVHHGDEARRLPDAHRFAAVLPVGDFVETVGDGYGPGRLTGQAETVLRTVASSVPAAAPTTSRLCDLRCEVVDPGTPAGFDRADPATSFFVTTSNSDAFASYVHYFPDALIRWNAISQDIRLRGIQPSTDAFNALYVSLRMAFVAATCLGFTGSIAATVGLLSKVTSMAKPDRSSNAARVERYMTIIDLARRFDDLTESRVWQGKLEAFRDSILEDPFM